MGPSFGLFIVGVALAAPRPGDPARARLDPRLRALAEATAEARPEALEAVRLWDRGPLPLDGLSVVAEPVGDVGPLVDAAAAAGFAVEAVAPHGVQLWVPYERLDEVGRLPGLRRAREPHVARTKETVGEGVVAAGGDRWQAEGLDGRGVTVGVVDVGFDGIEALEGTETPTNVVTDFSRGDASSTAHGTAVVELIYDFAPRARFRLATFRTDVEFAEAVAALADDGADVINGSVGFDNVWHADGTSALTRAADAAVAAGALYVAAAGNENGRYRVGELSAPDDDGVVAIAGLRGTLLEAPDGYAVASLRWSEPFGAAAVDLDLYLYNDDGTECGRATDWQDGEGDPYEIVRAAGCSAQVEAVVRRGPAATGDPEGFTGYLYAPDGVDAADVTSTETLSLPGDTRAGLSVGAYRIATDRVPDWSSRGPANDGRLKPDLVAPTGVSTVTYGREGFDGTSAAAAHVSGLAALWLDAAGRRSTPEELRAALVASARDLDVAGPDPASGYGALAAGAAPAGCGCATGAPRGHGAGAWAVVGLAAGSFARRRRGA